MEKRLLPECEQCFKWKKIPKYDKIFRLQDKINICIFFKCLNSAYMEDCTDSNTVQTVKYGCFSF